MNRAPRVEQQRAVAAQRLAEQEAAVDAARWGGTAPARDRPAAPRRDTRAAAPRRYCRADSSSAPRAPRSRRLQAASPALPPGQRAPTTPTQRSAGPESKNALALAHPDPWLGAHVGGERLGDPLTRLRAPGVHDPPPRVTPFAREARVEDHAELARGRRSARQPPRSAAAPRFRLHSPRPAARVSIACSSGTVVGSERRRDAALRQVAVRGEERPLRQHESPRRPRRPP